MKRVSFEVAKAIKEAGYPQKWNDCAIFSEDYNDDIYEFEKGDIISFQMDINSQFIESYNEIPKNILLECPTYLDVWLWLWREKKIYFGIESESYPHTGTCLNDYEDIPYLDPEEAIIGAIEYLVENDLIK